MAEYQSVELEELSCNIDDMTAEHFPMLMQQLFLCGARDAWISPIIMKSGRPGNKVSVLAEPGQRDVILETLFKHSSSLGVRVYHLTRYELARELVMVATRFGEVPFKLSRSASGTLLRYKPEHKVIKQIAEQASLSLFEVEREAILQFETTYHGMK